MKLISQKNKKISIGKINFKIWYSIDNKIYKIYLNPNIKNILQFILNYNEPDRNLWQTS